MQVYLISNKITNQNYVGQTRWDFTTRYNGGNWWDWSHSKYLKSSAKKYGIENFEVKILWEGNVSLEELTQFEDFYIKEYNCIYPSGYNFKDAGKKGRNYYNFKEYELKRYDGEIIKVVNLRVFCKENKLSYNGMLNMVCGIHNMSQGYALSSFEGEITNPDEEWQIERISNGEIIKVTRKNIEEKSKELGTSVENLYCLIRKKLIVLNKELKLKGSDISSSTMERKIDPTRFFNINTEEDVIIDNIYQFCKERGLNRSEFYSLVKKEAFEAHGWRLWENKDKNLIRKIEKTNLTILKISSGEEYEINNVRNFCAEKDINLNNFYLMIKGIIGQYQGYTVKGRDISAIKLVKRIVYIKIQHKNGECIEEKNAKEIESKHKIMSSQTIHGMVRGEIKEAKGWKIVHVKYLNDYYPEIINL